MKLLVINGPNMNMLGIRERKLYGESSYASLCESILKWAEEYGALADLFQSNHEGDIVDRIQQAYGVYDGIVINPAAYTHTSVAIPDALKAVGIPAVEVHLTDINSREPFRVVSYTAAACEKRFIGLGFEGYRRAIEYLCEKEKQ